MNKTALKKLLIHHEGLRLKPYIDTEGHATIGVGHKIGSISYDRAMELLQFDINTAVSEAVKFLWFRELSPGRKDVIVSMIFNMGPQRFRTFKRMIKALAKNDFSTASDELLDSHYHVQVGERAEDLALMLWTNVRM